MKMLKCMTSALIGSILLTAGITAGARTLAENDYYRVELKKYAAGEKATYECPVITVISGMDQEVIDSVNQEFYGTAEATLIEYAEMIQDSEANLAEYNPEMIDSLVYEGTFENIWTTSTVVSVKLSHYCYLGGAHGSYYSMGYSYDLTTGELLSMGELLGCDEDTAKTAVVAAYREHIIGQVEQITEESIIGAFDLMEYWVENDGLHVYLEPYAVASYAAGPQEAVVTNELVNAVRNGEVPQISSGSSDMISVISGIQAPASDFVLPMSSERALTWDDLTVLDGATVEEDHYWSQLAINEILARYGYVFNPNQGGSALEAYNQFEGKGWYEQAKAYCPSTSANEMLYTYITATELDNINLICEWQQVHDCYY